MASEKNTPSPEFVDLAVLRERDVRELLKISHSTLYALIKRKDFPPPLHLSVRAIGWRKRDIERWLQDREETK